MPNAERIWEAALGQLQMDMPRATFDTWVRDARLLAYEDGTFIIGVQNAYARDWLQNRLLANVKRVLTGITGQTVEARFVVWQEEMDEEEPQRLPLARVRAEEAGNQSRLNSRYTFDGFVIGSGNRLACAAAQAVAENPARAYNPLFVYGGVGLGKTHLLYAMGNACAAKGLSVLYVSSEEFTNDLINAIRARTTDAFRERYRHIDVLLIDDIQFIAGKESTQEEFFHTFNTLHGKDKQIVISSDRPPRAMVTLEERLRSRFEWGLTVDIQPPDFETRLAILAAKAERAGRSVDRQYLEIVARRVQSNIRELEGALTRILAYADLNGIRLSSEGIEAILADLAPRSVGVTNDRIIDAVCEQFGVERGRLLSADRSRGVALPRQVAMFLMRQEARCSLPQIGQAMGGRDHTTALYGCEKIRDLLETDDKLRRDVFAVRERLLNPSRAPASS